MLVFNIQHFSTHDGPGIRTVIFMKGCPLSCAWCHNPEGKGFYPELSFDAARCVGCRKCGICPNGAHVFDGVHVLDRTKCVVCGKCAGVCPVGALEVIGREYSTEELLGEVGKDAVFYGNDGGVTISGGEPFAQGGELIELLKALKAAGYNTAVETSGCASPENLKMAAEFCDLFLYDLKSGEKSREYVGADFGKLISGLSVLDEAGAKVRLRCPIIPGVNDGIGHIRLIAETADSHPSVKSVELEPYHPLGLRKYRNIGSEAAYQYDRKLCPETLAELLKELQGLTKKNAFYDAE